MFKKLVYILLALLMVQYLAPVAAWAQQQPDIIIDKTVSDSTDTPDGCMSTITLTVEAVGDPAVGGQSVDAILVIDNSGSMSGQPLADARTAASAFVDSMNLGADQVGVVHFESTAGLDQQLTTDKTAAKSAIDALTDEGSTNMAAGIDVAQQELTSLRHILANLPLIVLLSDGFANTGGDPVVAASNAKAAGTYIITIGLGFGADEDTLKSLASSPSDYYFAPDSSALLAIYQSVSTSISALVASNVVVTDVLSALATYVPGSASITPDSINGSELTWNLGLMSIGNKWQVSFKILQDVVGLSNVVDQSKVTYSDAKGFPAARIFPKAECFACMTMAPETPEDVSVSQQPPAQEMRQEAISPAVSASALPSTGIVLGLYLLASALLLLVGTAIIKVKISRI